MPLPKPLETLKTELGDLQVQDLPAALKALQNLMPGAAPKKKDILALQGRLESANADRRNNIVSAEDYDLRLSRVRYDFLQLLEILQEADFEAPSTPTAAQVGAVPKFMVVYDVADEPFATRLNRHLFLAKRGGKLKTYNVHADLQDGIATESAQQQLADTDYLLCLVTLNFLTSAWLDFVWAALSAGKRVIPLRIADISLDGSGLERYKTLPTQNRTLSAFPNEDAAYNDVTTELMRLIPKG
jgi:hypothetical protein